MPAYDGHLHAFQDDRTEGASLDRINRAKEHWRAYVQGHAELQLIRNKPAIGQAVLLSAWRAEDRALRSSPISEINLTVLSTYGIYYIVK